jgi:hypothetical protein
VSPFAGIGVPPCGTFGLPRTAPFDEPAEAVRLLIKYPVGRAQTLRCRADATVCNWCELEPLCAPIIETGGTKCQIVNGQRRQWPQY